MEDAYGFTAAEIAVLHRFLDRVRGGRVNTVNRSDHTPADLQENQQTAAYVALTPEGGIPALFDPGDSSGMQPGSAICTVYKIEPGADVDVWVLKETKAIPRRVFNITTTDAPANTYCYVSRDNYGKFILTGLEGTGSDLVTANTDGSEESTTVRLEFNKDQGIKVIAGATDADPDIVENIDASATQVGVVNLQDQTLGAGRKRFIDKVSRSEETDPADMTAPLCYMDIVSSVPYIVAEADTAESYIQSKSDLLAIVEAIPVGINDATARLLWSTTDTGTANNGCAGMLATMFYGPSYPFFAGQVSGTPPHYHEQGLAFWFGDGTGEPIVDGPDTLDLYAVALEWAAGAGTLYYIRTRRDFVVGDCKSFGCRRQPALGGSYQDVIGIDHNMEPNQVGVFRAGLLVGYKTATGGSYGTVGTSATLPSASCLSLPTPEAGGGGA